MSKNYTAWNRNTQLTEEKAKKFQTDYARETWPPLQSHQEFAWVLLESVLHEEATIAYGRNIYTDLINEIKQAVERTCSSTCAYDHYIKASNHLFNMIETGGVATLGDPVGIIGMDGKTIDQLHLENQS
jgi:hypothetical protein